MGYRQIDHTADLALEVWAEDEPALLVEGARAVVSILTEGATLVGDAARHVSVDALDPEDRLVQWLNEIIVLALVQGFLTTGATVRLRADGLDADLLGVEAASDRLRGELKSVTYHDLAIVQEDDRVLARLVIDV